MATTFFVFELGFAPFIDTVEGNQTSENHNALNGLNFGSATDPVYANLRTLAPDSVSGPGTDGDATGYNANNSIANERFTIDGGTARTFDVLMLYSNTVITYTDGSTAIVQAGVMQDTDGRIYLVPSSTESAVTDALEAKPIASVTLGTALPANGTDVYNMFADRFVLDIKDGEVEGTENADLIDSSYAGDVEGDRVDGKDNLSGDDNDLIFANGGNDTVYAGVGDDSVYGGDGNDLIYGDTPTTADAVLVSYENFEGGASGWTNNATTSDGQFGEFLGRFAGTEGNSSGGPLSEKTFDLADGYSSVVVEFDLYIIDSWDANDPTWSVGPAGDAFQLYVNGTQVTSQQFSGYDPNFYGDRTGTVTIGGVDYTFTFTLQQADTNLGFSSFNDQVWRVRLEAEDYSNDQITIGFGSTTQQDVNDESLGIDNFTLVSTNDTSVDVADAGGKDFLYGGAGNDTVYGGEGEDTLSGNSGADVISGGDGADQIQGGQGGDTITGGGGDDFILGDGQWYAISDYATITNGAATTLTVTNSADGPIQLWWIDGTGTLQFYATIQPGATYVQPTFEGHNWVLRDQEGYYLELIEGAPNQTVTYGAEGLADSIDGGDGDDTIRGQFGNDTIDGGAGNDMLYGGSGGDTLRGGDGADSLFGGDGNDTLIGGAGADSLDGGSGYDIAEYSGSGSAIRIDLTDGVVESGGDAQGDVLTNIELIGGSNFDDTIIVDDTGMDVGANGGNDSVVGGLGDDRFWGGDGNDTLIGGGGNDLLDGQGDDDSLSGGSGNDTLFGGAGRDVIFGGDGDDQIAGGDGSDTIEGGAGADTLLGGAGDDDITDTGGGADYVEGGTGNDFIDVGGGDGIFGLDTVFGGDGNDTIAAGAEADLLYGEADNDLIYGGDGDDTVFGGTGNDTINVATGADLAYGEDGDDLLIDGTHSAGASTLYGGDGNDTIQSGTGSSSAFAEYFGDTGDDRFEDRGGSNQTFDGGTGSDTYVALSGIGNDTVIGGEDAGNTDTDVIDLSALGDGVTVTFTGDEAGTITDGTSTLAFSEIEQIILTDGGDVVDATADPNGILLDAAGGDDTITGSAGDDTLTGGDGADSIDGGNGNDVIHGDNVEASITNGDFESGLTGWSGWDNESNPENAYLGNGSTNWVTELDGVSGETTTLHQDFTVSAAGSTTLTFDAAVRVEGAIGVDGMLVEIRDDTGTVVASQTILPTSTTLETYSLYVTFPDAGTYTLWFTEVGDDNSMGAILDNVAFSNPVGNDSIDGGAGDDTIFGGAGDDTLRGGSGTDTLYGGAGDDSLDLMPGGVAGSGPGGVSGAAYGGDGSDLFTLGQDYGAATLVGGEGGTDQDRIEFNNYGGTGQPFAGVNVVFTGNEAGIFAYGTASGQFSEIEEIRGTTEADTIDASASGLSQTLEGWSGDDTILGGSAADRIDGGDGTDVLSGGAGNDTITAGSGFDTITGGAGDDLIALGGDGDADVIVIADGAGSDTITGLDAPVDNGDGTFTGVDTLDVSGLTDADGYPVKVPGVTVGDDGNGNAVLSFPNGESLTLVGIDPLLAANPLWLEALGIPQIGPVDGTAGDDVMTPTSGIGGSAYADADSDQVDGSDGLNDTIYGNAGNDSIAGGASDDLVYGGDDNDTIAGNSGNDTLEGGAGNDQIDGGSGDDLIEGGTGNDLLSGGDGTDTAVFTGPVTDYSFDYAPAGELIVTDSVTGRDGQDTLSGVEYVTFDGVTYHLVTGDDGGNTTLQGPDDGTPTLIIAHDGADWGGGHDTSDVVFGGAGDDTLDGGNGDDTLIGEGDNDLLRGEAGEDHLFGGAGNDTLQGGEGNDTLDAGAGADVLEGGAGDDLIALGSDAEGDVIVLADGHGSDTITGLDAPIDNGDGTFTGVDTLDVSGLTDADGFRVNVVDVTVSDTNSDGTGDAILTFPNGESVTLVGVDPATASNPAWLAALGIPAPDYIVEGTAGNDLIDASFTGDPQGDRVDGSDAADGSNDDVIDAGAGNDTVLSAAGNDLVYGGEGDDSILGGDGNDTISGASGNDYLDGGEDADQIFGSDGDDTLFGGTGADLVRGGADNDTLHGDAGDDTLTGDAGADKLYGGDGADRITFDSGDTVYGDAGDDIFVLEDLGETGDVNVYGGDDGESAGGGDTLDLGFLSDRSTLVISSTTTNASGNTSYSGSVQMDNGSILTFEGIENIICFTPGTRIATARGAMPVEALRRGDLVVTRDNGLQPVRWIEQRTVCGFGKFAPVRIDRSVLAGQKRDLLVSPQHRVLFEGYRAELLFGESEVLASAVHLVDGHSVRREPMAEVTYVHFLLDRHEIVFAEGAATESFHPGGVGLATVEDGARDELFAIFPELQADPTVYGPSARRCLKRFEAQLMLS